MPVTKRILGFAALALPAPFALAAVAAAFLGGVAPARANPVTDPPVDPAVIASSFDDDDPFDVHLSVDWQYKAKRSSIRREAAGTGDPTGPLPVVDDLEFEGARQILTPRVAVGIGPDIEISVALPITLQEGYDLLIDADTASSSTIDDGILPDTGFDSSDPTGPGFTDAGDRTIFRGVDRSGLDQLHLGAAWAPFNQQREATLPTWKIGATVMLSLGNERIFDRASPDSETGAGIGLHELRLWTSVAKRTGHFEPFATFWWQAPIGRSNDSQFLQLGFGTEREQPQQHAGTRFGVEAIFLDKPEEKQRIGLELSALFEANFDGRAYTEMWEVFAFAGDQSVEGAPLVLDSDPIADGVQALSHPGVTNVQNYLTVAGRAAVTARIGEFVQFAASFEIEHDTDHIISFADSGIDLPTCTPTRATDCELEENDTVDSGTSEVNPYHVGPTEGGPAIDAAGSRYRVEGSYDYNIGVSAYFLF